jgi:hypothetical protein
MPRPLFHDFVFTETARIQKEWTRKQIQTLFMAVVVGFEL